MQGQKRGGCREEDWSGGGKRKKGEKWRCKRRGVSGGGWGGSWNRRENWSEGVEKGVERQRGRGGGVKRGGRGERAGVEGKREQW